MNILHCKYPQNTYAFRDKKYKNLNGKKIFKSGQHVMKVSLSTCFKSDFSPLFNTTNCTERLLEVQSGCFRYGVAALGTE